MDVAAQRQPVASPSVPIGPETGPTYLLRIESVLIRMEPGSREEVLGKLILLSRVRPSARPAYLRII